jgi:hypothetical protein
MNKLPIDLIYNHIMPFTYQLQDKNHLLDIRSFVSDYNILEHLYFCDYSSIVLLNDLEIFIYESNKYIFSRFKIMEEKNNLEVCYHEIMFFKDNTINVERKIRLIWGILTPFERTKFINKFIIDKYDI